MKVRVIRFWDLDTDDDPREVASSTAATREWVVENVDDRSMDRTEYYEQPIHVLDVAWDLYMERTALAGFQDLEVLPGQRLPTMTELGLLNMPPAGLSMIFDLAISAYRERFET